MNECNQRNRSSSAAAKYDSAFGPSRKTASMAILKKDYESKRTLLESIFHPRENNFSRIPRIIDFEFDRVLFWTLNDSLFIVSFPPKKPKEVELWCIR